MSTPSTVAHNLRTAEVTVDLRSSTVTHVTRTIAAAVPEMFEGEEAMTEGASAMEQS